MDFKYGFSAKGSLASLTEEDYSFYSGLGCTLCQGFPFTTNRFSMKQFTSNQSHGITPVAHELLMTNFATAEDKIRNFSLLVLNQSILNCAFNNIPYLVIHPGSASDKAEGLNRLSALLEASIDRIFPTFQQNPSLRCPTIYVETMAGSGSQLLSNLEEIEDFFNRHHRYDIGLCIDTAHLWGAGISAQQITELAYKLSVSTLIHFNNSSTSFGSKKDRHSLLTKGIIPKDYLSYIKSHFNVSPFIFETPISSKEEAEAEVCFFNNL